MNLGRPRVVRKVGVRRLQVRVECDRDDRIVHDQELSDALGILAPDLGGDTNLLVSPILEGDVEDDRHDQPTHVFKLNRVEPFV